MITLLDFPAAFDTMDHNILLHRLEQTVGIKDCPLSWFRSCLSGRTQTVSGNGLLLLLLLRSPHSDVHTILLYEGSSFAEILWAAVELCLQGCDC